MCQAVELIEVTQLGQPGLNHVAVSLRSKRGLELRNHGRSAAEADPSKYGPFRRISSIDNHFFMHGEAHEHQPSESSAELLGLWLVQPGPAWKDPIFSSLIIRSR